jgi:predicted phosphoribosyltransferase
MISFIYNSTSSLVAIERIENHVDKIICLNIRIGPIFAIADAYEQWYDLEDEEVLKFLRSAEWEMRIDKKCKVSGEALS